jgi:hypothetical protein
MEVCFIVVVIADLVYQSLFVELHCSAMFCKNNFSRINEKSDKKL